MITAVITAPRDVDYLPSTLASVEAAGPVMGRKILLCDGRARTDVADWEVHETGHQLGSARAFWRLLALLTEDTLFLQDDIAIAKGAIPYIEQLGAPVGAAATVYYQAGTWAGKGLHRRTFDCTPELERRFVGVLGVFFPHATLEKLHAFDIDSWPSRSGLDCAIGLALQGDPFLVHVPNLVQHVGAVTSIDGPRISTALDSRRVSTTYEAEPAYGELPIVEAPPLPEKTGQRMMIGGRRLR